MSWQIAIDGPAASGKSTVAKLLAKKLNFEYLDTGAMYRAIALKTLNLGIDYSDENNFDFLENTTIDFNDSRIYLDGVDVTSEIRTVAVSNLSSDISKYKVVRERLVAMQRELANQKNIIMDGRDIGTVVLPNANLKIFLTASVETRAQRRLNERKEKNQENESLEQTIEELKKRDYNDSNRKISPLKQADDAILIDTSAMSVNGVIDLITSLVLKRGYSMENLEEKNVVNENEEEVSQVEETAAEEKGASEEVSEETNNKAAYKEMQIVKGVVVEVQEAQPERKRGNTVYKAKEERVLIELEDGQQGYLYKKDTADIADDEDLFDVFIEGDEVEVAIKKIFDDGDVFLFSTVLVKKRDELLAKQAFFEERPILTATVVKKVSDFGLLLKYEDFTLLLPYQLMVNKPEDVSTLVGKTIDVVPLRVDLARIRVIVSEVLAVNKKKKEQKKEFLSKVQVGEVFDGKVVAIEEYGAFVEISEGVEGLLHISEIDHNHVSKVSKVLNIGDTVKVQVISLDNDHIKLSRKALMTNYWGDYFQDKKVGDVVTGKVVDINNAGVRVDLAQEVEGFIPRSEYSWFKDVKVEDELKAGDEVTAKLIEIVHSKKRVILSKKQLTENPYENVVVEKGEIIDVTVSNVVENGFTVSYQGIEGFMNKQSVNANKVNDIKVGDVVKVKVRVFDREKRVFFVSMKDAEAKMEREKVTKYIKSQDKMTNTIGDYINNLKK